MEPVASTPDSAAVTHARPGSSPCSASSATVSKKICNEIRTIT
jgi:hypothetical protein